MVEYDEKAAREIERSYSAPEIVLQRSRTLEALAPHPGEHVLDVGCGNWLSHSRARNGGGFRWLRGWC